MEQPNSNFISQELAPNSSAPQLQLPHLGELDQPVQIEVGGAAASMDAQNLDVSGTGPLVGALPVTSSAQYNSASAELQSQLPRGMFTTMTVSASSGETSTYREVLRRLNSLWTDQMREIQNLTSDHWKNQEFPLARIKKIMRMDEDVKMISTEVPVMFSRILEIFITELTMRSWLHTEDSKRRTVQRSDIAMAITKNDMFDFLIDIVPREEIQLKTKTQKEGGESLQLLPPDLLQLYIQQVINQTLASLAASGEEGEDTEGDSAATANMLQQLQLLQQLMQLQQAQQDQQQQQQQQQQQAQAGSGLEELQHMSRASSGGQYDTAAGGVDIQVLHSSASTPAGDSTTLEETSSQHQINNTTSIQQPHQTITYGQQALHHVDHTQDFHHSHQQQQAQQQPIFTSGGQSHITTVVIPQPLDSLVQPQSETVASSMLEPSMFQMETHELPQATENIQNQLESLASEQFISQQIPMELSSKFGTRPGPGGNGGSVVGGEGRVEFQEIPESESISTSISPITAGLPATSEHLSETVYSQEKHNVINVHIVD